MKSRPDVCKKCYRRSCDGCRRLCLRDFGQISFLSDGLSDDTIKKLTKIFEGACGSVGDFRIDYRRYCLKLAEDDLDFVLEFYKYTYFFNIPLSIKIRCIYEGLPYGKAFKDWIDKY